MRLIFIFVNDQNTLGNTELILIIIITIITIKILIIRHISPGLIGALLTVQ